MFSPYVQHTQINIIPVYDLYVYTHSDEPETIKIKGNSIEVKVVCYITHMFDHITYITPDNVDLEGGHCHTQGIQLVYEIS